MNQKPTQQNQAIVFWALWGAILSGILVMQFVIAGGLPSGTDASNPPNGFYIFCFVLVSVAVLIRWILIPRVADHGKLLFWTVIGLALIDGAQVLQLFLIGKKYPEKQFIIFVLVVMAVIQFAPIYSKKVFSNQSSHRTSASAPR